MNENHLINRFAVTLGEKIQRITPFGTFERVTAGFCMAIPFFLLIADSIYEGKDIWMLFLPVIVMALPLGVSLLLKATSDHKNYGLVITIAGAITLFVLYLIISSVLEIQSKPSIE